MKWYDVIAAVAAGTWLFGLGAWGWWQIFSHLTVGISIGWKP